MCLELIKTGESQGKTVAASKAPESVGEAIVSYVAQARRRWPARFEPIPLLRPSLACAVVVEALLLVACLLRDLRRQIRRGCGRRRYVQLQRRHRRWRRGARRFLRRFKADGLSACLQAPASQQAAPVPQSDRAATLHQEPTATEPAASSVAASSAASSSAHASAASTKIAQTEPAELPKSPMKRSQRKTIFEEQRQWPAVNSNYS